MSLCAARGNSPGTYYTFYDVNPDSKTTLDMRKYQQACIYGVALKWVFAEPTTIDASPANLQISYSPQVIMNPKLDDAKMQSMSTYQIMPTNQNRSVNRYFPLGYTKSKLGIDYFPTDEYPEFDGNDVTTYMGQLEGGAGPSIHFKVQRNSAGDAGPSCRL